MRFALVNKDTKIVEGVIEYDGIAEYSVPQNMELVNVDGIYCNPLMVQQEDGSFASPPEETNE